MNRFCKTCGRKLIAEQKLFCSCACRSSADKKPRRGCLHCGKTVKKLSNTFCSLRCRLDHNVGNKSPNWRGGRLEVSCPQCGIKFMSKVAALGSPSKFCSKRCYRLWRSAHIFGSKIWNWRGGDCRKGYTRDFNAHLKILIRKRDGFSCRLCGMPSSRVLSVHHIDYDKKNCVEDNLISLCRSCHTVTTNGDRDGWTALFKRIILFSKNVCEKEDVACAL